MMRRARYCRSSLIAAASRLTSAETLCRYSSRAVPRSNSAPRRCSSSCRRNAAATGLRLSGGGVANEYARRFTPVVPTPAQLQGAAGAYYSPELDVTWRMRIDGHTVALEPTRNLPDGAAGKLQPEFADTFSSDGGGFIVRFTRDSAGTITGFTLGAGRGLRALTFTRQAR